MAKWRQRNTGGEKRKAIKAVIENLSGRAEGTHARADETQGALIYRVIRNTRVQ